MIIADVAPEEITTCMVININHESGRLNFMDEPELNDRSPLQILSAQ